MLKVSVAGADGRVGRLLVDLLNAADDLELAGTLTRGSTDLPACDVLIDFSSPDGFRHWLAACRASKVAFVSGTTGLSEEDDALLDAAAADVAVLHATNTSLGVAVLNRLAGEAARMLGEPFDCEIVEAHHKHKRDAPSGTALTLGAATGRADVRYHSLRVGDVVGEHTLHLAGKGERLELTHRATGRETFARGALRAARWLAGPPARPPGRYAMADVLGL